MLPPPLQTVDRTHVLSGGRKLSFFSGCDYHRLGSHPEVLEAFHEAAGKYGLGVSASRKTTGEHVLYQRLEGRLRAFFAAEAALLLPTGYAANQAVAQALAGRFGTAFLDSRAHPSLRDASRFLDCEVREFGHRSPQELARELAKTGGARQAIVLTDGLFAANGSVAPLAEYLALLPGSAMILVDDAHAAGVLGPRGRGSLEAQGVNRDRVVQTITLSKAFGSSGGAVLCTGELREQIIRKSGLFAGSTPLPLPMAAAAWTALGLLRRDGSLLRRLRRNCAEVRKGLLEAGIPAREEGPVFCFAFEDERRAKALKARFLRAGIYPPFLKYPGGPAGGYFRIVVSGAHSPEQIENLMHTLGGTAGARAI